MKKALLTGAMLIAVVGLGTTGASAQMACLDFDFFCDATQVDQVNGLDDIDGQWFNWDCAGSNSPMDGTAGGGNAAFTCTDDATCDIFGDGTDFIFRFNTGTSTFDLDSRAPDGTITNFQTGSPFTLFLGTGCIVPLQHKGDVFGPSLGDVVLPN